MPATKSVGTRRHSLAALIADGDTVVAERFRTKMCRNFAEKGSCPYESRCMFAHGRHQLRTKQKNLSDGLVSEEAIRQFKRGLATKAKPCASVRLAQLSFATESDALQQHFGDSSAPSSRTSENGDTMLSWDSASELNSSINRQFDRTRSSPELTLSSLCWYRRNPYDLNNSIILSPSPVSSRTLSDVEIGRRFLSC